MSLLHPLLSLSSLSDLSVAPGLLPSALTVSNASRAPRGAFSRATVTKPWKRTFVSGPAGALPDGVAGDRSAGFDSCVQTQTNNIDRAR